MDVPGPEDNGANLPLDADDEDIRQALKRPAEEQEEGDGEVVEQIVEAVKQMRKVKQKAQAPKRKALEDKLRAQRLHPDMEHLLERAAMRPILAAMPVSHALRLGTVLRSINGLLWGEDALWKHWWLRDFPEVARDLGDVYLEHPPAWILHAFWREKKVTASTPLAVVASIDMPWRRWYQWSEFFRRSALYHIAEIQNKVAESYIRGRAGIVHDIRLHDGVNVNVSLGKVLYLEVPRFDNNSHPVARGLFLVEHERKDRIHFPDELYDGAGRTAEPTAESMVVVTANSPVCWLLAYMNKYEDLLKGTWKPDHLLDTWKIVLGRRHISKDMLLGGTTLLKIKGKLNCDYVQVLLLYCSWYAGAMRPEAGFEEEFYRDTAPLRQQIGMNRLGAANHWAVELTKALPAFPAVDNIWFVGKPICSGCSMATEPSVRCAVCKAPYCTEGCHAKNWQATCLACAQDK